MLCFVYSLWGCKEWSCWIASKHCYFLVTLSATMASTWRLLVSDGHRLGRQWLQGQLSEETARSLRQLVVDSGAASSSRATKGESLAILLEMFDRSSPVSRPLFTASGFLFDTIQFQKTSRYFTFCQVLNLWSATYTWCSISCACHCSLLLASCLTQFSSKRPLDTSHSVRY